MGIVCASITGDQAQPISSVMMLWEHLLLLCTSKLF